MEDGLTHFLAPDETSQNEMKKAIIYYKLRVPPSIFMMHILLEFILLTSACSTSQVKNINSKMDSTLNPNKILIVYLSRTNNTKTLAEIIQRNVGGTLVALELEKPYPENYMATVQQV